MEHCQPIEWRLSFRFCTLISKRLSRSDRLPRIKDFYSNIVGSLFIIFNLCRLLDGDKMNVKMTHNSYNKKQNKEKKIKKMRLMSQKSNT